jgi:hypothetical protein
MPAVRAGDVPHAVPVAVHAQGPRGGVRRALLLCTSRVLVALRGICARYWECLWRLHDEHRMEAEQTTVIDLGKAAGVPDTSAGDWRLVPGGPPTTAIPEASPPEPWVDVLACPCGWRRATVADISEREVVVAILAHLGLPTEAPPLARARSPGFDFTCAATARAGRRREDVARAEACRKDDAREVRGSLS